MDIGAHLLMAALLLPSLITAAQIPELDGTGAEVAQDVRVDCNSDEIWVAVRTRSGAFDGMIYPKGLSKNSSCMAEFVRQRGPVRYRLPLRSCNTMSTELADGAGVEYFNTIVVQPHRKLVTSQGRGFHVRCRYATRERAVSNRLDVELPDATPVAATAPMPACAMRIFFDGEVAEHVKIGDPLVLVVTIDRQEAFGLRVTDCLVRDGLGWGEQRLIDEGGCPVDGEIMGPFRYSADKTEARVQFQAHKFPYTASVYYQCNVQLCVRAHGGCDDVPPACGSTARRRRRDADGETPATIEVYSGLYVNEATDVRGDVSDDVAREKTPEDPNSICISQRNFAIGIAVAGLVLMLAVIAAILILLARRRHRKGASTTGSSIYSGPYTNTAYSHSS
ncbi:cuticlin-6 [Periplaneta americana]|uniref:cuticlin-6 n=1 Tax=Periplaneta americana TaxID=6978 RepID=UPI0037E74327